MNEIAGYILTEKIYESQHTRVYRGVQPKQNRSVIIKVPTQDYPSLNEISRFKNQYTIAKNLEIAGVVKPLDLIPYQNSFALILEDFGAISLKEYLNGSSLPVGQFLRIALELSQIVQQLGDRDIVHKDIKPDNILINPQTGEVKLSDFSISARLPKDTHSLKTAGQLQGTLNYIAPEQTGRINRGIDRRTDLYSLGVTFYEMTTGQVPFKINDPVELVYCHLAREARSPDRLNRKLPPILAQIILKLMAKNPEDRYQSARGLSRDLKTCSSQFQSSGTIDSFSLGCDDRARHFQLPEKLYGRDLEIIQLTNAFRRILPPSTPETPEKTGDRAIGDYKQMVLVSGTSGTGKSALISEMQSPILRQRGYFITGKFDQFQHDIPFAPILDAFRQILRLILTENSEKIEKWKRRLMRSLGINASAIVSVIPELELLLGKIDPVVEEIGAVEAENRFNFAFHNFIRSFSDSDRPIVLFLDDLQWVDAASLKLIERLMSDEDIGYLLIVGAYRSNEVDPLHPLMLTVDRIEKQGGAIDRIHLQPIGKSDLYLFVADALKSSLKETAELSELIYEKTGGNPFFASQLLISLASEGLFTYDPDRDCWNYDLFAIETQELTDDVVEFTSKKLAKLPHQTRELLTLAACIGNTFNLETLAIVSQHSPSKVAADLSPALEASSIVALDETYHVFEETNLSDRLAYNSTAIAASNPESARDRFPNYQFFHDRVQQAAYLFLSHAEKATNHYKIGQLLLANISEESREEKLFEIVNHLNMAIAAIVNPAERQHLAELNREAGRKVKLATAYETAVRYFETAIDCLDDRRWSDRHSFTLELYLELLETQYLSTDFDAASQTAEYLLERSLDLRDRVRVYELQIQMNIAQLKLLEAVQTGLHVLQLLDIDLITTPPKEQAIETLIDLPEMTDPDKLAAMRILRTIFSPAYVAKPELLPIVIFTMVHLSLTFGNCPLSAYAYAVYALILCGPIADIKMGYRYGKLALKVLQRFNAKPLNCQVINLFNAFVRPWKKHARDTLQDLEFALQSGLETGDIEYVGHSAINYTINSWFSGMDLEGFAHKTGEFISLTRKLKQEYAMESQQVFHQLSLNLLGQSPDPCELRGEILDESKAIPHAIARNNATTLFFIYLSKTILYYLFNQGNRAVAAATEARKYIDSVPASMTVGEHYFYESLALLACASLSPSPLENEVKTQLNTNVEKLQFWAKHAPDNYQHKADLIAAELARVSGKIAEAMELYDRAIAEARDSDYIQEEAIASERAGLFYLELGRVKIARLYLTDAYYGYARWGAVAKVNDLDERYSQLLLKNRGTVSTDVFDTTETISIVTTNTSTSLNTSETSVLDWTTVMRTALFLSEELVLENLIDNIMEAILETTGAQKGILILEKDRRLTVEAVKILGMESDRLLSGSIPLEQCDYLSPGIVRYVERTGETLVLNDARHEEICTGDPYVMRVKPRSLLCAPIVHKGKVLGIIYLENNLSPGVFTAQRLEVLQLLCSQAAISLENALLYQDLERSLHELQQTQLQLVHSEKMSSLGQLIAGVAHEINNPVGFVSGNLTHAIAYVNDVLTHLQLYRQFYPEAVADIQEHAEEIDLDYAIEDLPELLSSMKLGTDRIREIVKSLKNFSRKETDRKMAADLREGLDSTLLILSNRIKAKGSKPEIKIIKEYGEIPLVECFIGQLNQVFMNLLANAIDSLEDKLERLRLEGRSFVPEIRIQLSPIAANEVRVTIADNGAGMSETVRSQLFKTFFTTKPQGKGTGLGLSISHQIVVEKHGGRIECRSTLGEGTEFAIALPVKAVS
jgi:predicted ATPase/signal transduction histidine kinase